VADQCIYSGRVITLNLETATLPNGASATLEIAHHPGGAATVAEDDRGRVCLLRQYRHPVRDWLWELPAGKLEPNEPPLETARRELEEEAGQSARDWTTLGSIITTPGFCDEVIHLFHARGLSQVATRHDAHEVLEVHWRTRAQLKAMLESGDLRDAKTVIGIYRWLAGAAAVGDS
jgi:ADP-ribose pyrophosphatase